MKAKIAHIDAFGMDVTVIEGQLAHRPQTLKGHPDHICDASKCGIVCQRDQQAPEWGLEWGEIEFTCPHALALVNEALGTSFTMDRFDHEPCEDCK